MENENVRVLLVSDGRAKLDKSSAVVLSQLRCFSLQAMEVAMLGESSSTVTAHVFEATVVLSQKTVVQAADGFIRGSSILRSHRTNGSDIRLKKMRTHATQNGDKTAVEEPPAKMQVIVCLKEENAGKLDSHLWAFSGFGRQLNPKYVVLVDVGTKPNPSATYRLVRAMERDSQIGGCCGEIAVDHAFDFIFDPIVSAQNFEYKTSNMFDKAMESCFGFITVLPGAFSAYRFEAIDGKPLEAYFKSLTSNTAELGPFQGNMYLAEDRILVFELLAKKVW